MKQDRNSDEEAALQFERNMICVEDVDKRDTANSMYSDERMDTLMEDRERLTEEDERGSEDH